MNISDFNHPLSGSEKREVEFVDHVDCRIKIKGKYYDAYLIGGISLREEDYREIFS